VWKRAAVHLAEAEHIYVFGYSLPPSDQFFHLLYALGTISPKRLRRFWVFDPATSLIEERFRALLGPTALERFRYHAQPFGEAAAALSKRINESTS
jgi:hypothetical protein